jgi:hypothetical protein
MAWLLSGVWSLHISCSSTADVLDVLGWAQCLLRNGLDVFTLSGLQAWRADVGSAAATGAKGSIAVFAFDTFSDDFTIDVAGEIVSRIFGSQSVL